MLCETCEKRDACVELCPAAAAVANQDEVSQQEYIGEADFQASDSPWPTTKSNDETILSEFYRKRKKQAEIAEMLGISQQAVSKVIKKYEPILIDALRKAVVSRPYTKRSKNQKGIKCEKLSNI